MDTVIIAVHMYLVSLSENYSEATVQGALGNWDIFLNNRFAVFKIFSQIM